MKNLDQELEELCQRQPNFLEKGGLCVALVVTRLVQDRELPIDFKTLRTAEGGLVIGLGKIEVQNILESHGIKQVLAKEGGRTNRGSLGLMKEYVNLLNALHQMHKLDIPKIESWWIEKVRRQVTSMSQTSSAGQKLKFDPAKSLSANIGNLLAYAQKLQSKTSGANFVGIMIRHLVGAKLDLMFGIGKVTHHGFSVADHSNDQKGDFHIDSVAIHVTTNPNEALVRKCGDNLENGLKPIIITTSQSVTGAVYLLHNAELSHRVDVLDCSQFLTANIYKRSLFLAADFNINFIKLVERYNQIVSECEMTPVLRVNLA